MNEPTKVTVRFPTKEEQWGGHAGVAALAIALWGLFEDSLGLLLLAAVIVVVCANLLGRR